MSEQKLDLTFTDAAIAKVKMMQERDGKQESGLRFGVITGGCAGLSYDMRFAKKPYDNDIILDINGLKVFINPESASFVNGMQVDYLETLKESGFKYINPNASSSCGCGSSFS